jgi:acetyltransferase
MSLNKVFKPKSIAVIGASNQKSSVGYDLFRNIAKSKYRGRVYPVNHKRKKVQGVVAYNSVNLIKNKIDLAIIATPAKTVPSVLLECAEAGIKGVVIISAGFNEIGPEGVRLNKEISDIAQKNKMRIIGPNCLGFLHPSIGLNASFATKNAVPGKIAFISQSGALCTSVLDWAKQCNVGFSHFVSIGSMLNTGFADLIEYFGRDKETEAILVYMESLRDAKKFMKVAKLVSPKKPIIVLKVGKSSEGASAAKSHTGSLTGDDKVFDMVFDSVGVERVKTITDLFNCAKTLSMKNIPRGNRLTIVTNAGGPGVISTDALIEDNGRVAKLEKNTIKKLDAILPASWSKGNPVDILGDATPERYSNALSVCVKDKNTDAILVLLTPQSMTAPAEVALEAVKIAKKSKKPIITCWMGGADTERGVKVLFENNIPIFRNPENAVKSFMYISRQQKKVKKIKTKSASAIKNFKPKYKANEKIIKSAQEDKRVVLLESEAREFLSNYGIKSPGNAVARSVNEAERLSTKIGYPVVMKIMSPQILHKVDVGGVILNINSKAEAKVAFGKIIKNVKSKNKKVKIEGVFIEKMLDAKHEIFLGCKFDPIFGHIIAFGAGGTYVELNKDISLTHPVFDKRNISELINSTKISKILNGYRGMPGVATDKLITTIANFSKLVEDFPEIKEIDINPYMMDEKDAYVVDAKVIIRK